MQIQSNLIFLKDGKFQSNKFNPLEGLLSALGGCLGVYANKYLERHKIVFTKLEVMVSGNLTAESPVRIVNIKAKIDTDAQLGDKKNVFLRFVGNCPVHNTILNTKDIEIGLA